MRRIAVGGFAAVLVVGLCGCYMPFGIAYPTVSYTPTVPIDPETTSQIRAFRVDFTESHRSLNQADWVKCEFQEIDVSARQDVPAQVTAGITYFSGLYFFPGPGVPYKGSVRSSDEWMRVRLYRRGFQTIELGPDDMATMRLEWERAEMPVS